MKVGPESSHHHRAVEAGVPNDWTFDSQEELAEYIELIHPDPIDVISIHYYDDAMISLDGGLGNVENIGVFKTIADAIGKPLFIGEIGLHGGTTLLYSSLASIELVERTLPVLVDSQIPLTLYWAFSDDRTWAKEEMVYSLRYGKTDEALELIEHANAQIRSEIESPQQ